MEKPDTQEQLLGEDEDSDLFKSSLNEEQTKLLRVRFDEEEEKEDIYQTEPTRRKRKETIVIRKDQWRDICINPGIEFRDQRNGGFRGNLIKTSKYTILNFLPKNLFLQFTKYANVYFLAMVVLQCIPAVSITQGQPTILFPLGFVTLVSMVKDIIEDYKRYSSDTAENNRKVLVLPQGTQEEEAESREGEEHFKDIKWKSVKVGQLCKIKCDEYFPADMVLLNSDDPQGICYVETKNLDGETNMKHKMANKKILEIIKEGEDLKNFVADISCQAPNEFLYKFEGKLNFNPPNSEFDSTGKSLNKDSVPLDANQILLRGSSLRNTEYVYGVVVYTGHESKIMKNSPDSRYKTSKIEQLTNRFIVYTFIFQVVICLFASIYSTIWAKTYRDSTEQYLAWSLDTGVIANNVVVNFLVTFASWLLIFCDFVPISLLVTLEIVKFIQAQFINWDHTIFDETKDMPTKAQSSNLNEELGQVEYIFSDKTGTLTQNVMEFKKMVIGPISYGLSEKDLKHEEGDEEEESKQDLSPQDSNPEITNVNFYDPKFYKDFNDPSCENLSMIKRFLLHLALCHTVIIEKKEKNGETKLLYNASSPDELALVNAARYFGYFFRQRDSENNIILELPDGTEEKYQLLNVIEFDSTRKRMSVIVRMPNGEIKVLCKGADSIIEQRLKDNTSMPETTSYLQNYASEGLRTLLLAEKTIDEEEYQEWNKEYEQACLSTEDRDQKITEISEKIEWEFELIGATAIEDKLQDEVADTISILKEAGIKIWVLTGDKIETAINIGYSCKVLSNDMDQYIVDDIITSDIDARLASINIEFEQSEARSHGLIVAGDSLLKITNNSDLCKEFQELADKMKVVIACRVSPKQKAEIVQLVKDRYPKKTTLSIGDGANDVNMITTADIGVGISGLEGQQAARASDYAIGQFKFLKTLLLVHGRECNRRNAYVVGYMFYKNMLFVLCIFWFGIVSAFSGLTIYEQWLYLFYNVVFTAFPIMWFAVFDYEYPKKELAQDPKYYIYIVKKSLSLGKFFRWIFFALWQSMLFCVLAFFPFEQQGGSFWMEGNFVYLGVVMIVNIKILTDTNNHTIISVLLFLMSIFLFLAGTVAINFLTMSDLYGVLENTLTSLELYLILILFMLAVAQIDIGLNYINRLIRLRFIIFVQKVQTRFNRRKTFDHQNLQNSKKIHTGFAFSQEPGNAPQVVERVKKNSIKLNPFVNPKSVGYCDFQGEF